MTCYSCRLANTRHKIVPAHIVGSDPKLAIVGMGPGTEEDLVGIPFVGQAGRYMRENLASLGITSYYLSNIVKCWLPGNRVPMFDEVMACQKHLKYDFQCMPNIAVVLAVGGVALNGLLGTEELKITGQRGRRLHSPIINKPFIATYHPSYILRKDKIPTLVDVFRADIKLAWNLTVPGRI